MVFYEAPHKLAATLKDFYSYFGNRRIVIVREITKIHEEVIHTSLEEASELYAENPLKGEIVLVLEGKKEEEAEGYTIEMAVELAKNIMEKENLSASFAAKSAAKETGLK